jgi:hypothetical protein
MSNINGKVYAMNVVTPMKPWKTWILRLIFWALGAFKALQSDLIELKFIQFARWVIVSADAFPYLGGTQKRDALQYDYLLFFSNFNGTWNQYIDAFSAVLAPGLNKIWRWSEKFPGSVPVTPFKNYITSVQYDTDYYFSAYPEATLNDVEAAHLVNAAFESLGAIASSQSPEQFSQSYRQLVIDCQSHLGSTGEAPAVF